MPIISLMLSRLRQDLSCWHGSLVGLQQALSGAEDVIQSSLVFPPT